jgi:hypothetical protein
VTDEVTYTTTSYRWEPVLDPRTRDVHVDEATLQAAMVRCEEIERAMFLAYLGALPPPERPTVAYVTPSGRISRWPLEPRNVDWRVMLRHVV